MPKDLKASILNIMDMEPESSCRMSGIQMHAITDIGRQRDHNEDCVHIFPELGFAVLADGMGGHAAGEVASKLAVENSSHYLTDRLSRISKANTEKDFPGLVRGAITAANTAIYETAVKRPEYGNMGTTIVVAVFQGNRLIVGHVGDSRMYRFRGGALSGITVDHSVVQEQVNLGVISAEEARRSSFRHILTRAVGLDPDVETDTSKHTCMPGDIYLLCSDGLTDALTDETIEQALLQGVSGLAETTASLVNLANEAGGPDNISVILVRMP